MRGESDYPFSPPSFSLGPLPLWCSDSYSRWLQRSLAPFLLRTERTVFVTAQKWASKRFWKRRSFWNCKHSNNRKHVVCWYFITYTAIYWGGKDLQLYILTILFICIYICHMLCQFTFIVRCNQTKCDILMKLWLPVERRVTVLLLYSLAELAPALVLGSACPLSPLSLSYCNLIAVSNCL